MPPLKEVTNVHETRAVSRPWKLKLHVHAHADTHRSMGCFFPYFGEIMQKSVLLLDSLHFTVIDFNMVFSSSCWNISDGWLHRAMLSPLFLGTDSAFVSFKTWTKWVAVFGKKMLYEDFYRKPCKKNVWKFQEMLMDLWKVLISQRSSTWSRETIDAFLLLCS